MSAAPSDEAPALARLTLEEIGTGAGGIGTIHRAIADRAFGASGAGATPARVLHDAISGGVYAAIRGSALVLGRGAEIALRARGGGLAPPVVVGIINGLIGDRLEAEGNVLAGPISVRVDGLPVELDRAALVEAFPAATPRIVVFLHGLMETETAWRLGGGPTYGERLSADLGATPVYVRFNSGRALEENGRSLAELLDELLAAWPVEIDEIALVGHSLGGLVARAACGEGGDWCGKVRHVVSLGTPHLGAPLAQAVHHADAALARLPETAAISNFLGRRSAGIRDLREGSTLPLLEGATHCFVTATITRDPNHPVGRLIGDWLVLQPSGSGRSRRHVIGFEADYGHHVGGAHHLALLNHPAVYEKLRGWLGDEARRGRAELPG